MSATLLPSPAQWKSHFQTRGVDDDAVSTYLSYIRPLHKKKVPVIFSREHLAKLLGRTEGFLSTASLRPGYFYRSFEISKRSGAKRIINAPYHSLLECHRWINNHILTRLPVHGAARGYVRKKSIVDHALPHVGSKEVLTVDLQDFFPSINFARVLAIFLDIGYTRDVSITLARLCCLEDALPQGAPTSPNLSNIVCRRMDFRLSRMCQKLGVSYTRYADDLCFSADRIPTSLLQSLNSIILGEGFEINQNKTRMHSGKSNRKMVTGLNVAHSEIRLPKDFKRAISLELYHIESHGLLSHLAKRKITDPAYLAKLLGRIGYWLQIETGNSEAIRYKEILKKFISQQ